MNHWYLVASLPYLRFGEKPMISREAFLATCENWLTAEDRAAIQAVLENRFPAGSGVLQRWWNGEVELRDAIVRVRAKHRNVDASPFIRHHESFSISIERTVTDAFTRANPLEQEAELDRARWAMADDLAQSAPFGLAGILAFTVKLRIAERWAGLDDTEGQRKVEEFIEQATAKTGTES